MRSLVLVASVVAGCAAPHAHWSYEGTSGPAHWGGAPAIANYLFYPQAPATVSTTTLT